ncbi:DUF397 domain-containing protein [Saccharopolyspora rosea]|uniref:DUF397 domain-containing protein n=1 Tax=Saccharopolyspora rosea TaxID=524884 RepID=A0ABW3G2W8_9PSEU|nr:DUF397 domain-containing protein [Saccharopolyspora rosea]
MRRNAPSPQVPRFDPRGWRRASRCGPNGGNCVEINLTCDGVAGVRDSKRATGDVALAVPTRRWNDFIALVRTGRLDLA